jgi:hypothetical protein
VYRQTGGPSKTRTAKLAERYAIGPRVRINARLDADLARKVRALCQRTGRSTTEIVKESLQPRARRSRPFVACPATLD